MYLVLVVKTEMDIVVMGQKTTVPFSSAGLCGMCPVFNTKEEAEEWAEGKAQIIHVSGTGRKEP